MFSSLSQKKSVSFLIGIIILFIGLNLSKAITSLVTVYMVILLLIKRKEIVSLSVLRENKSFRWFLALTFWMVLSLMWSSDKTNGLALLVSYLNFFIWPLLMLLFSSHLNQMKTYILFSFLAIVTFVSIFQFFYYQVVLFHLDIREMTLFISHIRFALMVDIAFFIALYFLFTDKKKWIKIICIISILWLLFYTYYSQVLSGILGLIGGVLGYFIYIIFNNTNRKLKLSVTFFLILIGIVLSLIIRDLTVKEENLVPKDLPKYTKFGNPYEHLVQSKTIENGHFLDLYYCEKEVDSIWSLRSKKSLEDFSPTRFKYKSLIKRYLTSKGLHKDAEGMNQLTQQDIKNIENGISTIVELESGLTARYKSIKYELSGNMDPNGHSVLQRVEFLKASKFILKENWVFGVGLGSSMQAFKDTYKRINSKLTLENQWESHNQFLNIWITYGVFGLILFIIWLISIVKNIIRLNALYLIIFFVLISSFLVEETLSTLTGMTLFSFFAGFFQNQISLNKE